MNFTNRITQLLGIDIPVVQAPMGWIARAQLASAVSRAGGLGIIETSSGELDVIREEIRKMHELTDKPFGVNIAQAFGRSGGSGSGWWPMPLHSGTSSRPRRRAPQMACTEHGLPGLARQVSPCFQ